MHNHDRWFKNTIFILYYLITKYILTLILFLNTLLFPLDLRSSLKVINMLYTYICYRLFCIYIYESNTKIRDHYMSQIVCLSAVNVEPMIVFL